ncbi:hypothetical protein ANN_09032 [Periplaneta americana]|uniref:Uncharacterized protein n=1 Tax=Periplaneta americana TaxID=6978 RepID=A0ABQ8TK94_PERAM|nr:hypothetical protein ANN_09032 [Periplaneta americana]
MNNCYEGVSFSLDTMDMELEDEDVDVKLGWGGVACSKSGYSAKHLATYWGSVRKESYCVTTDTIVPYSIANLLRNRGWKVHEEIHCVSEDDSQRRVDITAINRRTQEAICFERDTNQALQINDDKRAKYVPCLPYLSEKYGISLYNWDVTGLLFGARGAVRGIQGEQGELKEYKGNKRSIRGVLGERAEYEENNGNTRGTRARQGEQGECKEYKGNTRKQGI